MASLIKHVIEKPSSCNSFTCIAWAKKD